MEKIWTTRSWNQGMPEEAQFLQEVTGVLETAGRPDLAIVVHQVMRQIEHQREKDTQRFEDMLGLVLGSIQNHWPQRSKA